VKVNSYVGGQKGWELSDLAPIRLALTTALPPLTSARTPLNMATPFPSTRITFGPAQICGNISSVLWGVTCVQTYIYVMRSKRDRVLTKSLVAAVLFVA
jgi:hypothetical protein